jgi:hypothetical protein
METFCLEVMKDSPDNVDERKNNRGKENIFWHGLISINKDEIENGD